MPMGESSKIRRYCSFRTAASSRRIAFEAEPGLPSIWVHEELYRLPRLSSVLNLTRRGCTEAYDTMIGHEWERLCTPRIPAIPRGESAGCDASGAQCEGRVERPGF